MNYLDFIILGVVTFFFVKGLVRGFIHEILTLLGIILALVLATKYMSDLSNWIDQTVTLPSGVSTILGFLLIFFAVLLATQGLIFLSQKFLKFLHLDWLNRLGGGIIGFLKGATVLSLLFLFLSILPFTKELLQGTNESKFYKTTKNFAPGLFNFIMMVFPNSKSFYQEFKESLPEISPDILKKGTKNLLNQPQNRQSKSTDSDSTHE
ncbi:MAG: CvpA family protein [Calditrichaeota bacterium]|nr:MAG: CvpA family protein [Calditrichota bacterium]